MRRTDALLGTIAKRIFSSAATLVAFALSTLAPCAYAGGPRFVTGTTYPYAQAGAAIPFYTSSPVYYTDPGDLSSTVSHAQADAMVAAAAATWNVPTSSLLLSQGGTLAEHVSGANTYFDGTEVIFPADVSAGNWQNIPIAVIYDTDGSVIDTLLGQDASDPSGCRDTGVVESVDSFGPNGTIQHAMLILNGRCVGTAPEQLSQMQYQLERAFGRVLGLAWSQVNDNIFTGATLPTAGEIDYWPIMHPIDVLCGPYTYQCITNPFQLRMDDLSTLTLLYPVTQANLRPTKTLSAQNAVYLTGNVEFPTGQGMDWVNVTVTRTLRSHANPEPWEVASAVVGATYEQNIGNPITGPEASDENVGGYWEPAEAIFVIPRVEDDVVENLFMVTEPIDPLYTGEYAIAPYQRPPVSPSGSPQTMVDWSAVAGSGGAYTSYATNAASSCSTGADGTQTSPAASDPSGWWTGLLCAAGHTSWWSVSVKPGRSWTIEVTALDETGGPTMSKAQPVIGVWNAGDSGLPTVASAPVSMNTWATGVTQVQLSANTNPGTYTFAVADQYGEGRPDFAYQARVLYADSISPAIVGSAGGVITITGEGFRPGNSVTVNGVAAHVVSWSSTQIVAQAPGRALAGATLGSGVDVTVTDGGTGGTTTISSALTYSNVAADVIALVTAPAAGETGIPAATPFAVRVYGSDGVTPLAGATVQLSVTAGSAVFAACAERSSCALQTDSSGLLQTAVTGGSSGTITLMATEVSGGAFVSATMNDANPVRIISITTAPAYAAAGAAPSWTLSLTATQDGSPATGVPVVWTAAPGLTPGSQTVTTNSNGLAGITVQATSPLSAGAETVTACAWSSVCKSWTIYVVPASQWSIAATSGTSQNIAQGASFAPVGLQVTDLSGHPLQGATVAIYQTVDAWEGTCPSQSRCAASPVLASAHTSSVSDANGALNLTPLQLPGVPQTVNVAAVTGTQGLITFSLVDTP
jgi:hypothetical protein